VEKREKSLVPKSPRQLAHEAHLQKALPKSARVPVEVNHDLHGNTVQVHYVKDAKGRIADVHIQAGPHATPKDIELHARTVKSMKRYSGMSFHAQKLKDRFEGWVSRNGTPPVGSKAWEAKLEIQKLPNVIADRTKRLSSGDLTPQQRTKLEQEVTHLEHQLDGYKKDFKAMDKDPGKGFVAAKGTPLSKKELNALKEAGLTDAEIKRQVELMGDVHLFRGTTEGFPGNPVLQKLGITPASVDPLVATVFGLEGKNKGKAILAFGSRTSFESGEIDLGNVRRTLEREVQVDLPPHEFEKRAQSTISIDKSRKILKDMGVADLPASVHSSDDGTQILNSTPRLNPEQIQEFLKRAAEVDQ
jgi:hypothetical protein